MKLFFVGSFYPSHLNDFITKNNKNGLDNAASSFQRSILVGLKDLCAKLTVITSPALKSYPRHFKKVELKDSTFSHSNNSKDFVVGYINLPFIKYISRFIRLCRILRGLEFEENSIIFVYSIHTPFLIAINKLKKKQKKIIVCLFVPDLPQYMSASRNLVYRFLKWIDNFFIKKNLERVDCFVLFTKAMRDKLNIANKPYVLVEGVSNGFSEKSTSEFVKYTLNESRIILYTGSLSKRYGIINLLEAFKDIKSNNYQLWICGSGDSSKLVEDLSKQDERVKFFGHISHDQVIALQKEATVLVNPRTSEGDYTKYSFPSKTLEYLSSGTPTILHRLEGIPDEYYNYCYVSEEQSSNGLKETILKVCETEVSELIQFGKKAQDFIFKTKNSQVQVHKIITMIESNFSINFKSYQ